MLRFDHVTFSYPGSDSPVIRDLSFTVEDQSFVSVIGASGSGKTTIFRLLNSMERPETGSITLNGQDIRSLKNYAGYMPQQDLLFPWRTVKKNVMLPMQIRRVPKEESEKTAMAILEKVALAEDAEKYPRELSGGMRQRASFARTLCTGCDLLLLDEPFSALDSITRTGLQEWLREQWESLDKTILFITHSVEEAIYLSEKIYVITETPVHALQEIRVPLPKKRTAECMNAPEILTLKEQLHQMLRIEAAG